MSKAELVNNNQMVTIIKEQNLEPTKSQMILDHFKGFLLDASEWERKAKAIKITDITQVHDMQAAREIRLELRKIRTSAEKTRQSLKESIVREGRAIDGIANIIKATIIPIEEHLEEQEKYVEKMQQRALDGIESERVSLLQEFEVDLNFYDLRNMPKEAFDRLLKSLQDERSEKIKQEVAARQAQIESEQKRQEEEKRLKAENEKLKKEAEAREKAETKERAKREAEEKKRNEELAKERAKREADLEKQRKEAEQAKAELARIEREKEENLRREALEKAEAERVRLEREEAQKAAGDQGKIETLLLNVKNLKENIPSVKSKRVAQKFVTVTMLLNDIIHTLEK